MSLRRDTFSAARWTTAATVFRTGVLVVQTAALARLLSPADFGAMAVAAVLISVIALVADLGIGSALMHFPHPDQPTFSTIYWLNLSVACLFAALFALVAWPVARLYSQPELIPVLLGLSLSFPLSAVGQPFRILAEKELLFGKLARQEIFSSAIGFLVALLVAISGGGVYAFVAGMLSSSVTTSVLAWADPGRKFRPGLQFDWSRVHPYLAFGIHRISGNLWNTLSLQADVLIAGLHATASQTAFYAVPREQCLRISNTMINPIVARVSLPVMTKVQQDKSALRSIYLQTLRLTASMNFPMYALIALFADQLAALLLGNQWQESAFYLRLFAIWGMIRSTGNLSGSLTLAVGMVGRVHAWNLANFIVTVPLLWITAKSGGLPAMTLALCGLQVVVFFLLWRILILPACGARFAEYLGHLAPAFLSTAVAATLTFLLTLPLAGPWKLPGGIALFGAVYLGLSLLINRAWISAMLELFRPARTSST